MKKKWALSALMVVLFSATVALGQSATNATPTSTQACVSDPSKCTFVWGGDRYELTDEQRVMSDVAMPAGVDPILSKIDLPRCNAGQIPIWTSSLEQFRASDLGEGQVKHNILDNHRCHSRASLEMLQTGVVQCGEAARDARLGVVYGYCAYSTKRLITLDDAQTLISAATQNFVTGTDVDNKITAATSDLAKSSDVTDLKTQVEHQWLYGRLGVGAEASGQGVGPGIVLGAILATKSGLAIDLEVNAAISSLVLGYDQQRGWGGSAGARFGAGAKLRLSRLDLLLLGQIGTGGDARDGGIPSVRQLSLGGAVQAEFGANRGWFVRLRGASSSLASSYSVFRDSERTWEAGASAGRLFW